MDWLAFEREFWNQGLELVAGVDEVGRGCLAGPVAAAAVILPLDFSLPGINDSKKLSAQQREELFPKIQEKALAHAVVFVSVEEIDRINILEASLKAMQQAVEKLSPKPQALLIDGKIALRKTKLPQRPLIQGDSRSASIAAASILAKVTRDRWMTSQEAHYPQFGFAKHKGYGTKQHREALSQYGITPLHRKTFAPVKQLALL
ncbi:MAG: ribonuclease HII [Deltaproteobacteria bacterium]|nr:ribonuclease HII [Deltaproteobacteria bacterium]